MSSYESDVTSIITYYNLVCCEKDLYLVHEPSTFAKSKNGFLFLKKLDL